MRMRITMNNSQGEEIVIFDEEIYSVEMVENASNVLSASWRLSMALEDFWNKTSCEKKPCKNCGKR